MHHPQSRPSHGHVCVHVHMHVYLYLGGSNASVRACWQECVALFKYRKSTALCIRTQAHEHTFMSMHACLRKCGVLLQVLVVSQERLPYQAVACVYCAKARSGIKLVLQLNPARYTPHLHQLQLLLSSHLCACVPPVRTAHSCIRLARSADCLNRAQPSPGGLISRLT